MKMVLVLAGVSCAFAQTAAASELGNRANPIKLSVQTLSDDFDLSEVSAEGVMVVDRADAAPGEPVVPHGIDTRKFAWNPLGVEMALVKGGPVLGIGAIGSRKKGMPKLAHVVLDWDF